MAADQKLRVALLGDAAHVNVQRWCDGLSAAGADVHLFSFARYHSNGSKALHFPMPNLPAKLHYIAAVPYVRSLIRRIKPHVLLAYYVTGYGTLGALTGYHPLVQVTSGSDVLIAPKNPILRRLLRFNFTRADMVTAWAPHMADAARKLGASSDRLFILPRGIPFKQFSDVRIPWPSSEEMVGIVCTRSLKPDYNIDLLIKAVGLLQSNVKCFLTLAGDGPQRSELMTLTRNLGLQDRVRFLGFIPNEQLPFLLAKHNLYVSLVASDGVSASLLEAMAVGLIPIVPKHPANSFWVRQHETGLLLNELTPVAIAKAIHEAISNTALRRRAWEENPKVVRDKADMHCNSEQYIARFRRLVKNWHPESNRAKPACG